MTLIYFSVCSYSAHTSYDSACLDISNSADKFYFLVEFRVQDSRNKEQQWEREKHHFDKDKDIISMGLSDPRLR